MKLQRSAKNWHKLLQYVAVSLVGYKGESVKFSYVYATSFFLIYGKINLRQPREQSFERIVQNLRRFMKHEAEVCEVHSSTQQSVPTHPCIKTAKSSYVVIWRMEIEKSHC